MASLSPSPKRRFDDIPLEKGLPLFGNTFQLLANQSSFSRAMVAKHGAVYRSRAFFGEQVVLSGPDANEFFLMDRDRNMSSKQGWARYLDKLFPNSLMLMDFDHHRANRKIMAAPFKAGPMKAYVERINAYFAPAIADWARREQFLFYPAIKKLTLDLAADIFFGFEPGPRTDRANKALTDMVAASIAVIRFPVPGGKFKAGLDGRRTMIQILGEEVASRRGSGAQDMFTILCNATDEDGQGFSDAQVVDHMIFLWMAAHDTITSSLTTLVYQLAKHPDWQDRLAQEVADLHLNDPDIPYERLGDLVVAEAAFKEALRLLPPVPAIPRRLVRDTEFKGNELPAGTEISIAPGFAHKIEDQWENPNQFDPNRFLDAELVKNRHKFAWVPFGGGAHMCLGLHFAYMAAKIFLGHVLRDHRFEVPDEYEAAFQIMPITKPKDGLPVKMRQA